MIAFDRVLARKGPSNIACARLFGCAMLLSTYVASAVEADRSMAPGDPRPLPGAMPYQMTADLAEAGGTLRISPDGRLIAYQVKRRPPGFDPARDTEGMRFRPDGTPNSRVGLKVYVASFGSEGRVACELDGDIWAPSWSPDSKRLALYSNAAGAVQLWLHDVSNGVCRKVSDAAIKTKHWEGDEPVWSRDGASVYVPLRPATQQAPVDPRRQEKPPATDLAHTASLYSFRTDGESRSGQSDASKASGATSPMASHFIWENNADLARIDVGSGTARILVPHDAVPRPSVLRLSPSGRWLSYLSVFRMATVNSATVHDLVVLPAAGGERHLLFKDQPIPGDDYYRLSYQWHPTDDRLAYLADGALWVVDFSSHGPGRARQVATSLGELADSPLAFTRDGCCVLVGLQPDRKAANPEAQELAVVPLEGDSPIKLRINQSRWELGRALQAGSGELWQPELDSIRVQVTERSSGESAVLRIDTRTGRERILWQGPPIRLSGLASTAHHRQLLAWFESFDTPRDVHVFEPDFSSQRLTRIDPRLHQVSAGTLHVFNTTVPQFDGELKNVRTGVILPPGKKPGDRVPGIVMFYPGSDMVRWDASEFGAGSPLGVPAATFTSRGFAVIYAHVLTGPGGEPGHVINEIVDSLMPQVYRAADLGYVDVTRLGLAGQSFGAFSTAAILTRTTLFRAAVATNGLHDLGGAYYGEFTRIDNSDTPGMTWLERTQPRIGDHLWTDLRRVIENSPCYQADKIRTPLFMVQGIDDLGFSDAQKMYTALRRLGRPAQLSLYEGSGHYIGVWPRANAIDASKRIVSFFREHLGDPAAVASANQVALDDGAPTVAEFPRS